MLIRCPECRFERQIDENAIPANAAMATCPHCQYRFRFRNPDGTPVVDETPEAAPAPQTAPAGHAGGEAQDGEDDLDEQEERHRAEQERAVGREPAEIGCGIAEAHEHLRIDVQQDTAEQEGQERLEGGRDQFLVVMEFRHAEQGGIVEGAEQPRPHAEQHGEPHLPPVQGGDGREGEHQPEAEQDRDDEPCGERGRR